MIETFKNIKWFFKQEYKRYILVAIALLFLSGTSVIPARLLGLAIEEIASRTITVEKLVLYASSLLIIPLSRYFVDIIYHYTINALGQKMSYQLREQYIEHLFELDASIYAKYTKGDLISRATNDLQNLTVMATSFLQTVVFNSGVVISAIIMMVFTIDPLLTLLVILIMPISIFCLNKARMKKRKYYRIHHEIYGEMTENVLETIEGVKTVRAYCEEEDDYQKTKEAIDNDIKSWKKILSFETFFQPLFEFVYAFCYFVAFAVGSYMVITSRITSGDLITFVMYVGMLNAPLIALSNVLNTVNNSQISNTRYHEIMKLEPIVADTKESINVLDFKEITFDHVSFQYPFDNHEVIKDINFSIKKGETIGIVGPTGAGKSTLIRQLLREFNVTKGTVYLDGIDIKNYKISDVHNLVGYVPQSHILFRKTVDENILIGNPNAKQEQVTYAINQADFQKDLKELTEGANTMVSELGASLSGGQRQRLSIARALVKDPMILILDDSLSAVDALTEANIVRELQTSRHDKTNIIVAHRFSAIYNADKIIVLQNGTITDVGTHQQLLKYDNWYRRQYIEQLSSSRGQVNR